MSATLYDDFISGDNCVDSLSVGDWTGEICPGIVNSTRPPNQNKALLKEVLDLSRERYLLDKRVGLQGYLAHKKHPPRRPLQ